MYREEEYKKTLHPKHNMLIKSERAKRANIVFFVSAREVFRRSLRFALGGTEDIRLSSTEHEHDVRWYVRAPTFFQKNNIQIVSILQSIVPLRKERFK